MTPGAGTVTRCGATVLSTTIAVVAWTGLTLNVIDVFGRSGSVVRTIWDLLEYFTILTNLWIALLFTGTMIWPGAPPRPKLVACLALAILLVGVVYHLLLRGLYQFTPITQVADVLLHQVTPILVPMFWLLAIPKGRLTLRDPLLWAIYPLAYFGYALARGAVTGHYPYPFMDVAKVGLGQATVNAVVIAVGFLATGAALVWLDGMLAGRSGPRL